MIEKGMNEMSEWAVTVIVGPIVGLAVISLVRIVAFDTHPFKYKIDWLIVGAVSLVFLLAASK